MPAHSATDNIRAQNLFIIFIIRFLLVERSTDCGQRSRGRSGSCRLAQQGGKLFRRDLGGAHHLVDLGSFCFLNPPLKAFNILALISSSMTSPSDSPGYILWKNSALVDIVAPQSMQMQGSFWSSAIRVMLWLSRYFWNR